MAAKTKCLICDEAVWGFDLTAHLFSHLAYKKRSACELDYGHICWCGRVNQTMQVWRIHLWDVGGWKVHYAACALGLNTKP